MNEPEARRILNVDARSSPEDVRQAYLDLVRVWHPDRFQSSGRLRAKAERKLQEINAAYAVVQGEREGRPPRPQAAERQPPGAAASGAPPDAAPAPSSSGPAPLQKISAPVVLGAVAAGLSIALFIVIPLTMNAPGQARPAVADQPQAGPPPAPAGATGGSPSRTSPRGVDDPNRPDSGTDVLQPRATGQGALTIRNDADRDAVVVLAEASGSTRAVYVRAGQKVSLLDLPEGRHRVRVTLGRQWRAGVFAAEPAFFELDEEAEARSPGGAVAPGADIVLTSRMERAARVPRFRLDESGRAPAPH